MRCLQVPLPPLQNRLAGSCGHAPASHTELTAGAARRLARRKQSVAFVPTHRNIDICNGNLCWYDWQRQRRTTARTRATQGHCGPINSLLVPPIVKDAEGNGSTAPPTHLPSCACSRACVQAPARYQTHAIFTGGQAGVLVGGVQGCNRDRRQEEGQGVPVGGGKCGEKDFPFGCQPTAPEIMVLPESHSNKHQRNKWLLRVTPIVQQTTDHRQYVLQDRHPPCTRAAPLSDWSMSTTLLARNMHWMRRRGEGEALWGGWGRLSGVDLECGRLCAAQTRGNSGHRGILPHDTAN